MRETWPYWSDVREEASKIVKFLDHLLYKERMRGLGFNLKRKLKGGWYQCIKIPVGQGEFRRLRHTFLRDV